MGLFLISALKGRQGRGRRLGLRSSLGRAVSLCPEWDSGYLTPSKGYSLQKQEGTLGARGWGGFSLRLFQPVLRTTL